MREIRRGQSLGRPGNVGVGKHHIRTFKLPEGMSNPTVLASEIQDMIDVLMGRVDPPVPASRIDSMAEVAAAYYARAKEIEIKILEGEREGTVLSSSGLSRFRKGELRSFIELVKLTYEMGSRRITLAQMELQ